MAEIKLNVGGAVVTVATRSTLLRGREVVIDGTKLVVAAPLLTKLLEFTEALEALTDGRMKSSEFGRLRRDMIVETVRRNYPELPDAWFAERDSIDYQEMEDALKRAAQLGEATAGNP